MESDCVQGNIYSSDKLKLDFDQILEHVNLTEGKFNTIDDVLKHNEQSDSRSKLRDDLDDSQEIENLGATGNQEPLSSPRSEAPDEQNFQPLTHLRSIRTTDIVSEIQTLPFISENVSQIDTNTATDPESTQFFMQISDYIIKCLFKYGVCVIDNFLGDEIAYALHSETETLFNTEVFSNGQIVGDESDTDEGHNDPETRGDKVMWLDCIKDELPALNVFVARLDALMNLCSGRCGHVINSRSKIMLTCYPSNGTKYKKHVDNASHDGRCITCLYYQNKNWDCSVQGGMLKVYPRDEKHVANIEPLFDRLVLFWSNERCPHKVLPVYADRYAVTMWYYDYYERAQHLQSRCK